MRLLVLFGALLIAAACGPPADPPPDLADALRQEEEKLLAEPPPPWSAGEAFGAEPFRIDYLPALDRYLVLLRNTSEVLLCDAGLHVLDRRNVPRSPAGWALQGEQRLYVAGQLSSQVAVFELEGSRLRRLESVVLSQSVSLRDLVFIPGPSPRLYLLDGFDRQLVGLDLSSGEQHYYHLGAGPTQILHQDGHLIINLLFEHAILIVPLVQGRPDFGRASRIENDGPFWSLAAHQAGGRLIVAAGGIENLPLDRSGGEFGNVDSFLHLFRVPRHDGFFRWEPPFKTQAVRFNLSEAGVVTPKALAFQESPAGGTDLWVAGYGSDRLVRLDLAPFLRGIGSDEGSAFPVGEDSSSPREVPLRDPPDQAALSLKRTLAAAPGISDLRLHRRNGEAYLAWASPLLDRVEVSRVSASALQRVAARPMSGVRKASQSSRLGEALFFTTLLSPANSSDGSLSRLTCEACHFEGHIDGRVHFTGRDDIHLATKTLHGMADNLPLFSRGGDQTLASMVMAEFQVANQGDRDVFELQPAHHPWLADLLQGSALGSSQTLTPQQLRKAFLSFFVDFRHRPNPWAVSRGTLDASARRGLEVFRQRCEDCHQAVESTRPDARAVPFGDWPEGLLDEKRDLIWGAPFFTKTGLRPYVDPAGTRVPSLRRVWLKYPYFTDGSSATIEDVLKRFRYRGTDAWHHLEGSPGSGDGGVRPSALTPQEAADLLALLRYF